MNGVSDKRTDTGRLTATLGRRSQRIIYGELTPTELDAELSATSRVDLAHVVMLVERALVSPSTGARLLREIISLREQRFAPLYGRPAPRGAFLAYENHLIDVLGPEAGGRLHTGRSRNDLKATVTAVAVRAAGLDLMGELLRLQAVLLCRARAHRAAVMPVYTHFQAAMPVTYGYYLLGVQVALDRDIDALEHALTGLARCPLGANAVSGTDLPIDPQRTAVLLGFEAGPLHAIDAVASRDVALRVLAAVAGASLTLSRIAADLQLWSTTEFGFLVFPDRLVGGSSAMPQKRNAFLLEHVKAKPALVLGALSAASIAVKGVPFTNSIEVGTEAVGAIWPGLSAATEAILLTQALVSGARPVPQRMRQRAEDGFVTATLLANRLVREGVPFRIAHQRVGSAVRAAVAAGSTRLAVELAGNAAAEGSLTEESLAEVVAAHQAGGGPGIFNELLLSGRQGLAARYRRYADRRAGLRAGETRLATAVTRLIGGDDA